MTDLERIYELIEVLEELMHNGLDTDEYFDCRIRPHLSYLFEAGFINQERFTELNNWFT